MDRDLLRIDAGIRFQPEVPLVALLRLVLLRVRSPFAFSVEEGVWIMVASTVPVAILVPLASMEVDGFVALNPLAAVGCHFIDQAATEKTSKSLTRGISS